MPTARTATASRGEPHIHLSGLNAANEWRWAADWVSLALERDSDITLEDVHRTIMAGEMDLWLIDYGQTGAIVTQFRQGASGYNCLVVACGGKDMETWLGRFLDELHAWAADSGAGQVDVIGRRGWARALAPFGYRESGVILSKELEPDG